MKDRCTICGKPGNNPHHYITRRNRAIRWYLPAGICLCPLHHTLGTKSAHKDPEWFRSQMLDIRGRKWLDDVVQQSNKICKANYQTVKDYLDGKRENYL